MDEEIIQNCKTKNRGKTKMLGGAKDVEIWAQVSRSEACRPKRSKIATGEFQPAPAQIRYY